MSKTESTVSNVIEKKYKVFDLDTLAIKEIPVKVTFTPATDVGEAQSRLGNDTKVILEALNSALREKTLADARNEAKGNGVPKAAVLKYINPYRLNSPYKELVTVERGKDGWKEQYAKQTTAILEAVKNVPFIMDAIKNSAWEDGEDDE